MANQPEAIHTAHVGLPWPDRALSPNSKPHWAVKGKAVAKARQTACYAAILAGVKQMPHGPEWKHCLSFDFCPPDRRRRDAQNMPAMMKAAIDGIADALNVDDGTFEVTFPSEFGPVADDGGSVLVVVRAERTSLGGE